MLKGLGAPYELFKSQADFGTTFKVTGGHQKAGKSSLKRVSWVFFTISK
jgi:hypothetical protein